MKNKLLLIILGLFICSLSFADENHYINVFVGDRAAGLGGAYTALADGPEGVFYNPAGLAFSSSQYFSLSANAIQFKMLYYKDVYTKSDNTPFNYMRYSLSFIPNFFGFIQKAKHFTWAITVSCPDSEFYDQRENATIIDYLDSGKTKPINVPLNVNFNYKNQIYEAGPSIAFLPNKYFAIGMSAFFRYRDIQLINQSVRSFQEDADIGDGKGIRPRDYFETTSNYENQRILGLNFQIGIQVMPIDKLSIGYSISTPFDMVDFKTNQSTQMVGMMNSDNYSVQSWKNSVTNNTFKAYHLAENGLFRPLYIKQALGFCFFINKSILLTLDGYLYIPIQNLDINGNLVSYQWNKDTNRYDTYLGMGSTLYNKLNVTGNVAMGFECYITPNFPLRLGFFTNFTNSQEIKDGDVNKDDYIHLLGGSFSFGFSTSDMSVNLGAVVQGGVGKAQILSGTTNHQEVIGVTANLFISGGYQF
ncbi:MAG: outer membrane protein transport protein [Spirochaetales bacterium]|nr:outer membrane protein transport protein [Spirochaetales bacterium]